MGSWIDLQNWDMSAAEDLSGMFHNTRRTFMGLQMWNVKGVKNFAGMFQESRICLESERKNDIRCWKVLPDANLTDMFKDWKAEKADPTDVSKKQ